MEIAAGEVTSLVRMVAYQPGAVVSRAIINRTTGTLTLFAFDGGQSLSEHTAPFDALAYVLDGNAEITIDGQPAQLSAGEAILMPANRPHAVQAISQFKMLLIMIRS
ncbi:MAG: cupin domain-containing protein [Acidobacteriaceae bacterium]|jgi:quercetin dioxygenase-like cupin family protein